MSDFIAALIIDLAVSGLAAAAFVWRYKVTVSRGAQLTALQYRFFSLRDRAIRLVAGGKMREDDPRWQRLYAHMNDSARAASVDSMRNGLSFVLNMLRKVRPVTAAEIDEMEGIPPEARELTRDYVRTVLQVWALHQVC